MGSCEEGQYSGKYANLMNNLSDWASIEDYKAPNCDTLEEFTVGPITSDDMAHSMISLFDSARHPVSNAIESSSLKKDILSIVLSAAVDPVFLSCIFLATLMISSIIILLCEIHNPRKTVIGYFNQKSQTRLRNSFQGHCYVLFLLLLTLFKHYQLSPLTSRARIILCLCIIGFFCITNYFFAYFATSMLMTVKIPKIDSLKDLAERPDVEAVFMKEYNLWQHFKYSKSETLQKIWKKARILSIPEVQEQYFANAYEFMSKIAIFSFIPSNQQFVYLYCQNFFENPIIHTAKELFLPTFMTVIFRPGVDQKLKDRISEYNQRFGDYGIFNRLTKFPEQYQPHDQNYQLCKTKLGQYDEPKSEGETESLGIDNLYTLFISCGAIIGMATMVLLVEQVTKDLGECKRKAFGPRTEQQDQSFTKRVIKIAFGSHKLLKMFLIVLILLGFLYFFR